jgi:CRP/FNR family cyclic AMP-dependent transcriptional regulator
MIVCEARKIEFSVDLFGLLSNAAIGRLVQLPRKRCLFAQGDKADSLYVLQQGRVKVSSVLSNGKQAIVNICVSGDLTGEECMLGAKTRNTTAIVMESCSCLRIHRIPMLSALHSNPDLLDCFIRHLLRRNLRLQGDIASDRSQSAEHRLARVLLLLAGSERANPEGLLPKMSHEELAEMVGTTRPRITQFMVRMKETGHIRKQGNIRVDRKLLCVLLKRRNTSVA